MNKIKIFWERRTRRSRRAKAWAKKHPYFPALPWSVYIFLLSYQGVGNPTWAPLAWAGMMLAVLIALLAIHAIIQIITRR